MRRTVLGLLATPEPVEPWDVPRFGCRHHCGPNRRSATILLLVIGLAGFVGAAERSSPQKPRAPPVRRDRPAAARPPAPASSNELRASRGGLSGGEEEAGEEGRPASENYAPAVPWMRSAKFVDYVQFTSALRAMLVNDWQEAKGGPRHALAHFE